MFYFGILYKNHVRKQEITLRNRIENLLSESYENKILIKESGLKIESVYETLKDIEEFTKNNDERYKEISELVSSAKNDTETILLKLQKKEMSREMTRDKDRKLPDIARDSESLAKKIETSIKKGQDSKLSTSDSMDVNNTTHNTSPVPEHLQRNPSADSQAAARPQNSGPGTPGLEPETGRAGAHTPENGRDIIQIDETTWQVSPSLVSTINNIDWLSSNARVTPYVVQGKTRGFRLSLLKRDSLLHNLGIKRDDVIQRVNGYNLFSPADMLTAYRAAINASTIRVEILRKNRDHTLTYIIR